MKKLLPEEGWILQGIPILFLIGSLMHFLYELSGENVIVGAVAAVNESVWEHLKMVVLPVILWWILYYVLVGRKNKIDKKRWFLGALVALLTSIITIPLLFYFYSEGLGIESLIVDIALLFISLIFGQVLGLHLYRKSEGISPYISIVMIFIILSIFVVFTFNPPKIPIFKDGPTGTYGIEKKTL